MLQHWVCFGGLISLSFAQQPPAFNIPKFSEAPNQDFRTNVCARQEAVINGEMELKDALRGLNLTVAITDYSDSNFDTLFGFSDTGTIKTEDPGLFVVLLDEIAMRYVQTVCKQ